MSGDGERGELPGHAAKDGDLAAITADLRSLPFEDRVPGYGGAPLDAEYWLELLSYGEGGAG